MIEQNQTVFLHDKKRAREANEYYVCICSLMRTGLVFLIINASNSIKKDRRRINKRK